VLVAVSEEAVTMHLPFIERLAKRLNGVGTAEFDDLRQEGCMKVVELVSEGRYVTHTAVKNAMLDWVRVCRRQGFVDGEVAEG
jgi:DNA-directed RNA polymerase specialized sigma24 family protein